MNYSDKAQVIKNLEISNDTMRFIVPALNAYGLTDNDILIEELRGAYIQDENKPELGFKLFLKYKPSKTERYTKLEAEMTSFEDFEQDYDVKDSVVFVFTLEKFKEDLELMKKGLFSQFSDEHKQRILKFWRVETNMEDPLSGVILQTEVGKEYFKQLPEELQKLTAENELWPRPTMGHETML